MSRNDRVQRNKRKKSASTVRTRFLYTFARNFIRRWEREKSVLSIVDAKTPLLRSRTHKLMAAFSIRAKPHDILSRPQPIFLSSFIRLIPSQLKWNFSLLARFLSFAVHTFMRLHFIESFHHTNEVSMSNKLLKSGLFVVVFFHASPTGDIW